MPIPNVSNALRGWTTRTTIAIVTKAIVNHRVTESRYNATADLVVQPMPAEQVNRKPTEQRSWKWSSIWIRKGGPVLNVDDVVEFKGHRYRIESVSAWEDGGYRSYQSVEDYDGGSSL